MRAGKKKREGESEGASKNRPLETFKKLRADSKRKKARARLRAVEKNALCFFLQNEGAKNKNKNKNFGFLNKSFAFFHGQNY